MLSILLSTAFIATASAAFDPLSKNNVITYWGQGADQARLIETCKNSAYDIINIGFVNIFPDQGKGGWPGTNFGNACYDVYQNANGVDTEFVKTCPYIGEDIIACQQTYGKKIFLSLGGGGKDGDPNYYLKTVQSARQFANFLWAAFGPVSASTTDVPRPWGNAAVDGFDFDIESFIQPAPASNPNYQKAFYADMIKRFKSGLFPTDTSKQYYISGAPQCIIPDAHFTDVVANAWFDFLFIQFYNTEGCSARDGVKVINGKGTADISYLKWVAAKSLNPNVRMSIGLPAAKKASGLPTYYLTPTEAQKLIKKFYKQKLFGGVMLWEATFAAKNKVCTTDYGTWMKNILKGQAAGKDIVTTCPAKRDTEEYAPEPEAETTSSSSSCTSTVTLTRSRSSSSAWYGTGSASSPAAPVTTSAPVYSASESGSPDLCTKTTTFSHRNGWNVTESSTSLIVEPCAPTYPAETTSSVVPEAPVYSSPAEAPSSPVESPSEAAPSYAASPEELNPAASSPVSPEDFYPGPSLPASEACGPEVTVTVKEQSTVYVTATAGSPSDDVTALTTIQSTSTVYNTHTAYLTKPASENGSGYDSPSSSASIPSSPEASSPSDYENSPVGGEGSSSSAPAAPSHGHHHGQSYSHGHGHGPSSALAGAHGGEEEGPESTTTVVNVVTVVPVPVTSDAAAAASTAAPYYPIGPAAGSGNGTASGTASASGPAWPTYTGPQQTGGAGTIGVSATLLTMVAGLIVLLL